MKYKISRVSEWDRTVKPCKGAKKAEFEQHVSRYATEVHKGWTIELKTLEDLQAFIEREGRIIMNYDIDYQVPTIEIYDDWYE